MEGRVAPVRPLRPRTGHANRQWDGAGGLGATTAAGLGIVPLRDAPALVIQAGQNKYCEYISMILVRF